MEVKKEKRGPLHHDFDVLGRDGINLHSIRRIFSGGVQTHTQDRRSVQRQRGRRVRIVDAGHIGLDDNAVAYGNTRAERAIVRPDRGGRYGGYGRYRRREKARSDRVWRASHNLNALSAMT